MVSKTWCEWKFVIPLSFLHDTARFSMSGVIGDAIAVPTNVAIANAAIYDRRIASKEWDG